MYVQSHQIISTGDIRKDHHFVFPVKDSIELFVVTSDNELNVNQRVTSVYNDYS